MANRSLFSAFDQGHALNFGHRGARHYAPDNTLAAFELAAQQGADGVELDVHLTADGALVCIHNYSVDETTNGSGMVREMTLAEIKVLDAGSHFAPRFADERVPTLPEVFEALGERLLFDIELKGMGFKPDGLEAAVADAIAEYDMIGRVIITSFNAVRLRRMRKINPQLPLGFLYRRDILPYWLLGRMLRRSIRYEADHPMHNIVTPKFMTWARRAGIYINSWVVNDPARMAVLRDLGVNMIITDKPDVLSGVLHGES